MAHYGTSAVRASVASLSHVKDVGTQCMQYLGQLRQMRQWTNSHSVAPAFGNLHSSNGGRNRDLKRFLEEVGTNPKEARYWLKQFQLVSGSSPSRPFAVVQVDQEIFQHSQQLKALSSNLAFLHRNDMKLLVVHGANLPDDKYLSDQELQNSRHQVTTETMIMVNFLEASGAPAHPIFSGSNVLRAESIGRGTKGKVTCVNKEALEWCISSGHIPVLSSIGETSSSQLVSIDAVHATAEVAKAVQAMKVLFLNTTGGLRDRGGRIIEEVHIPADLDALMKQSCSSQDHKTKELVCGLVADLPPLSSVVITSAKTILTELFTHHGSGTMFKKTERILKYSSLKDVDIDRLKKLVTRERVQAICCGTVSGGIFQVCFGDPESLTRSMPGISSVQRVAGVTANGQFFGMASPTNSCPTLWWNGLSRSPNHSMNQMNMKNGPQSLSHYEVLGLLLLIYFHIGYRYGI
ncbi:N-acetylglutamate synthase, mitochondrial-like isoform X3 [Acanthaster planci]|uniref:N-acetylglutamate synthase, mitochondrial-like isoform X3 n=1 Tax=Acanthaster planci TaxID=133434 RepID=A0A8B7ZAC4_ACAPL|nr:N-acetylglutamate synthase, mitochondrial-like isoform X3 [Acanthaster planci]